MSAATTKPKAAQTAQDVAPVDPEEIRRRIYATDWNALSHKLYKYAFTLTKGDDARAKDLSQTVMEKEWNSTTRKWNPNDFPDFHEHCKARLFGIWRDRGRSGDDKYATGGDPEGEVLENAASPGASPEKLVSMADGFREVFAALREEATRRGDHVVLAMLDLQEKEGILKPAEIAESIGMAIDGVYDAVERKTRIENAVAEKFGWPSIYDRVVGAVPVPQQIAEAVRRRPPSPAAGPWRWGWMLAHAAAVAALATAAFTSSGEARVGLVFLAGAFLLPFSLGCAVAWVHTIWAGVGRGWNFDHKGKEITPAKMALPLLVPGFNLVWMFRANWLIAEAVEREAKGRKVKGVRGSKWLATAACVATLVPGVNLVVAPVLWLVHTSRCERGFARARAKEQA